MFKNIKHTWLPVLDPPAGFHRAARGARISETRLIWGPTLQKDKDTLKPEVEPTWSTHMAFNRTWWDTSVNSTQLLEELKCLSLETRCCHQLMCITYKISCGLVAMPHANLVKPQYTTGGHKYEQILNVLVPTRIRFCYIFGVNLNGTNPVMIL